MMALVGHLSLTRRLLPVLLLLPALALAQEKPTSLKLRLAGGEFRPADGNAVAPEWFNASQVASSAAGDRYLVAMSRGPLSPEQRRQLQSAGAELLGYIPDHGYRLRVSPEFVEVVRSLPFVEWLGELPAHFKLLPPVREAVSSGADETRIRIVLAPGEPYHRVLQASGCFHIQSIKQVVLNVLGNVRQNVPRLCRTG